ncbi:MAG TPA: helix-turn-helix transcriptional regulator [Candidatus Baltobacteraceae bacterium]|nr:helix-turn-helix transcriptional regulator [Candidatus Baltobacteraceae bacterium]
MTVLHPFDVNKAFGERLRAERELAGISQSELASRSKIGRTTIANMEVGGQAATVYQMLVLADALGVEPATLLPQPSATSTDAGIVERLLRQRQAILNG